MKKSTLFKTIAAAALMVVVGNGAFAQVTGSGTLVPKGVSPQDVDYVTVGSTMPYSVSAFDWGTMSSILGSAFKWEISADGTLYQSDGTSSLTQIGTTGYFTQKDISVKWTATGDKTITLTEIGQVKSTEALTLCPGSAVTLTVKVLDRPTVDWGTFTDPSGCSIAGGATINLVCSGSKTIKVNYTVIYTPLDVSASSSSTTGTATIDVTGGAYAQTNVAGSFNVTANNVGKYEVKITGVTDVVSEKSFGALADKTTAQYLGSAGTQYPAATSTKVFYVYPQPTTSPIQHLQNL